MASIRPSSLSYSCSSSSYSSLSSASASSTNAGTVFLPIQITRSQNNRSLQPKPVVSKIDPTEKGYRYVQNQSEQRRPMVVPKAALATLSVKLSFRDVFLCSISDRLSFVVGEIARAVQGRSDTLLFFSLRVDVLWMMIMDNDDSGFPLLRLLFPFSSRSIELLLPGYSSRCTRVWSLEQSICIRRIPTVPFLCALSLPSAYRCRILHLAYVCVNNGEERWTRKISCCYPLPFALVCFICIVYTKPTTTRRASYTFLAAKPRTESTWILIHFRTMMIMINQQKFLLPLHLPEKETTRIPRIWWILKFFVWFVVTIRSARRLWESNRGLHSKTLAAFGTQWPQTSLHLHFSHDDRWRPWSTTNHRAEQHRHHVFNDNKPFKNTNQHSSVHYVQFSSMPRRDRAQN